MHKIFFGFKRAFHGTLRLTRRTLASIGLTAARFDMLYIVDNAGEEGMRQRDLQRALGVAASTVSRMLASLEQLGLVSREVMLDDHRCTWVELTAAGQRSVRNAASLFIESGQVQLAVDSALCPDEWHDPSACRSAFVSCHAVLERLRRAYGDVATPDYPRSPDIIPIDLKRYWARVFGRPYPYS